MKWRAYFERRKEMESFGGNPHEIDTEEARYQAFKARMISEERERVKIESVLGRSVHLDIKT